MFPKYSKVNTNTVKRLRKGKTWLCSEHKQKKRFLLMDMI